MPVLQDIVTKGATGRSVTVRIVDGTTGLPDTSIVFNTSGIDLWYRRDGGLRVAITEATLGALNSAYSSGGFLHISDGEYRLDLPDAAYTTGANYVDFGGTVTGKVVIGGRVRLIDCNLEDAVRLGLTTLPNAAAEATGGLYTRGTGAGQINQAANGMIDTNPVRLNNVAQSLLDLKDFADDGYDPSTNKLQGLTTADAVTTVNGLAANVVTATSINADAVTAAKIANGALDAATFASGAFDAVWTVADRQLTAFSTALALSVWHVLEASIVTASTIGLKVKTNLDAAITSRSSHAAADIWSVATRLLTAGTNIVLAKGTGVTGFNDLSAAQVNTEVDTAIADARLDELLAADSDIDGAAPPTVGSVFHELMSKTGGSFTFDQTTDSLEAVRDNMVGADAGAIADAVWDELLAAHTVVGSFGEAIGETTDTQSLVDAILDELLSAHVVSGSVGAGISAASSAGDPWATNLPGAYGAGTAGEIIGHVVRASVRGTSDSGSTTTMIDAARTEADPDYWKGCLIEFTSGAVLGQTRLITGFTPASDTITFAPATTQAISTQTYKIIPAARADLQLWLGSVVNALISGRIDSNVQAMANDVVTAAVIANAAIDAATFAAGAIDANAIATDAITNAELATAAVTEIQAAIAAGSIASVTGNVGGNVVGSVGSMAANGISAASIATGAITNAKFAAGAIDAAAVAADAVDASALAADALTEIENTVWNAVRASHTTAGSFGQGAASVQGNVTGSVASVTADVGITQAGADKVWGSATRTLTAFSTALALSVWDVLASAVATASSLGLQIKTNLDAAVSTRSTYAGADTAGTTTLLSRIVGTLLTGNHSPQSGDSFARIGANGASLTALSTQTSVDDLPTNVELTSALAGADDAVLAALTTIQSDTNDLQTRLPAALSSGRMVAEAQVVGDKTGYALSSAGANAVRDAVSDDIVEAQGSITVQQALSVILAAVAGRTDTGGLVFRSPNGSAIRITATVDASNNRTAITLTPSA